MQVKSFLGGFDKNLSYLIWCQNTKLAAIIDPAVNPLPIFEYIESNDLILEKIFITHTHQDHYKYLDDFKYKYPLINLFCYHKPINDLKYSFVGLADNEVISIGQFLLTTIHTPGHFADSICLWSKEKEILFTGDTIFIGRTGRTISSHSDVRALYKSIYDKLLKIPHETIIYPGHHYGYSKYDTLSFNIKNSPFFQCKSEDEFIEVMNDFEKKRKK